MIAHIDVLFSSLTCCKILTVIFRKKPKTRSFVFYFFSLALGKKTGLKVRYTIKWL